MTNETDILDDFTTPDNWMKSDNIIKVIGVGGGGCNAVNFMYHQQIEGCTFVVCNTDAQALAQSDVPIKVQLGEGLGAGMDAIKGRNCAIASQDLIVDTVLGPETKMLFVTAGMGGGTGTGAAPVIASLAKERGILTVGVVTLPFQNEKNGSLPRALDGIRELQKSVDSLLLIDNEKLAEVYKDELLQKGFPKSDEILATAIRGITEIISRPGYKNVDFEDVKTTMKDSGMALMGSGTASGPNRIMDAVEKALNSPLLYDFDLQSARRGLVNLTVPNNDKGITFEERGIINKTINERIGNPMQFKEGVVFSSDPDWGDKVRVTIIATGFQMSKLTEIIGENRGNIIEINEDYSYNPKNATVEEENFLSDDVEKIVFNSTPNKRRFHYEEKPVLYDSDQADYPELERTPALRRNRTNE